MSMSLLPFLSHEQLQDRIVYRDVAQRLMAGFLGLETGAIEVKMTSGVVTGSESRLSNQLACLNSPSEIDEFIHKRLLVLTAGVMGEMEWFETILGVDVQQKEADEIYENGSLDDSLNSNGDKIKELLVILAGLRFEPCNCSEELDAQTGEIFCTNIWGNKGGNFKTQRKAFSFS